MWCPVCKYGSETCRLDKISRCPQCGTILTESNKPLVKKPFEQVSKASTTQKEKRIKEREDWTAERNPRPSNII